MATTSRPAPVVLLVLDGWGYRAEHEGNAIAMANVPTWDRLWARAPRTLLEASDEAVGLPCGQIGNSEVGHLNLGAGRVVKQDLVRISHAIKDGSFFENPVFVEACRRVKQNGGTLHLVGLIGTGGVHAIDTHLLALLDLAERAGVPRVAIQVMLDGRDTMPRSGLGYLEELIVGGEGPRDDRQRRRPLLRHGPRPSLGAHGEVVRQRGARRRARGDGSAAGRARGVRARRDRRVRRADGDRRCRRASPSRRCATATR